VTLGYAPRLYLLAFDHRGSFEQGLFEATPPISDSVRASIVDAKNLIYEAHLQAVSDGAKAALCGVLVDEEYGTAVARRAQEDGVPLAMPVERSGRDEFEFQYGEDFAKHIEDFNPTFAKVLVRYNPEGDAELNRRQTERLATLSTWLRRNDRKFLFELLIPATTAQLDRFEGNQRDYDRFLRPDLTVEVLGLMQAADVEPDVWKIEGLDRPEDCARIVTQARSGGRAGVVCVVLGRGADENQVLAWLRAGAQVQGFDGFAVGRTIWHEAMVAYLGGRASRAEASSRIAAGYRFLIDAYIAAEQPSPTH
jgi:myo-inositol catabolism protein IolC